MPSLLETASSLALAAVAGLVLPGCQRNQGPAEFVGLPFCVSEVQGADTRFAQTYVLVAVDRSGSVLTTLTSGIAGPQSQASFLSNRVDVAVLACPEPVQGFPQGDEWADAFREGHMPMLCPSQSLVWRGELELERDERSNALGRRGVFRMPKLALDCREGEPSQAERYTYGQIMEEFARALGAYYAKHEALPKKLDVFYADMREPPLPPDPWGNELRFEPSNTQILLRSAGPDSRFDSDDDVVVLEYSDKSSTHQLGWEGVDYAYNGDYAAFLARRGHATSP